MTALDRLSDPECEEMVTPWYRAPELWLDRAGLMPTRLLRLAVDAWSYGCVLFGVMVRQPMFERGSVRRVWCLWHGGGGPQTRDIATMIAHVPKD